MDGRLWWLTLRTVSFVYLASLIVDAKLDLRRLSSNISGTIRNPAMSRLWKIFFLSRRPNRTATFSLQSTPKNAKIGFKDTFVANLLLPMMEEYSTVAFANSFVFVSWNDLLWSSILSILCEVKYAIEFSITAEKPQCFGEHSWALFRGWCFKV